MDGALSVPMKAEVITVSSYTPKLTPKLLGAVGKKFNHFTVLDISGFRPVGSNRAMKPVARVRCECGTEKEVLFGNVASGAQKSCGCVGRAKIVARCTKHGHSKRSSGGTRTFHSWCGILQRCNEKTNKYYNRYGGRGITVCERWQGPDGFKYFLEDMGECPSTAHSIDRIDNNAGYCKENCQWADAFQQSNNRRNNKYVVVDGQKLTVAQAERALGFRRGRIAYRLASGWTPEEAIRRVA